MLCYSSEMARPRLHDLDAILDAAELLTIDGGPNAATLRKVAAATGASNGSIYHAYPSRSHLVGAVWLRAAHRFLKVQQRSVAAARSEPALRNRTGAIAAVVAAADAPALFAQEFPDSAKLIFGLSRRALLGSGLPPDLAAETQRLDSVLRELFIQLAQSLWGRSDGRAVQVIEECVVGLPTALILRNRRKPDPTARLRLEAAVRAVLEVPLPPHPGTLLTSEQSTTVTPTHEEPA